ncbi:MAG: hypothetical protein M0008_09295 [Actinomycetota bacterium]|nr:hypothetical protein [Actinomycetota bacterium]
MDEFASFGLHDVSAEAWFWAPLRVMGYGLWALHLAVRVALIR